MSDAQWQDRYHDGFRRPGLLAAASLLAGHLLAAAIGWVSIALPLAVALLALAILVTCRRSQTAVAPAFCLLFLSLAFAQEARLQRSDAAGFAALRQLDAEALPLVSIEGRLERFPRRSGTGWNLVLRPDSTLGIGGTPYSFPSRIAVRVSSELEASNDISRLVPGDRISALGRLTELPFDATAGEREAWTRQTGAVALLRARRLDTSASSDSAARGLQQRFLASGHFLGNSAERFIMYSAGDRIGGVLTAMSLGRTHHLTQEQRIAFRRSGLMHVFAVSGLHTMLIGGLMIGFLRLFGLPPWLRLLLLVVGLALFASMAGLRSSVLRASVLLIAFEGRNLIRRPVDPLAALGTIAAGFLILSPRAIWQIDFQMSFLCATAIVLVSPWMDELQRVMGPRVGWGWSGAFMIRSAQVFFVSLFIQLMLAPVLLYAFQEVSLVAPFANLVLLIPVAFFIKTCYGLLAIATVAPATASYILEWLGQGVEAAAFVADRFGAIPGAVIEGHTLPVWFLLLYYAVLLLSPWTRLRRLTQPRRPASQFVPPVIALVVLIAWLPVGFRHDNALNVWFLDVGQGDAVLIRTPDGFAGLVDSGPPEVSHLLPSMLRARGVHRLSFVLATHADADHIGAMPALLHRFPVDQLIVGGSWADTVTYRGLIDAVEEMQIPVVTVGRATVMQFGRRGVTLSILHPSDDFIAGNASRNEASIVTRIEYAGRTILLTGDAERDAEASMLAAGNLPLQSDLLMAGHHGAGTSTSPEFVRAVSPAAAVISCGAANRFGHPAPIVLQTLEQAGVTVWRTDLDGTVRARIAPDGRLTLSATRRQPDPAGINR